MACQAYLDIGVMTKSPMDLVAFGCNFGDEFRDFTYDTGITLVNPKNHNVTLKVKFVLNSGFEQPEEVWAQGYEVPFSVSLNSRYKPGLIDWEFPHGNGDGVALDWDEIKGYLDQVRVVVPNAILILNHIGS